MPGELERTYMFFASYTVPVFVFASGVFATKHKDMPMKDFILRRAKQILLPYFALGILNILIRAFVLRPELGEIIRWGKELVRGQRDHLFATAMWFLPCIFGMTVVYHLLQKLLKNKWSLLAVCTVISIIIRFNIEGSQWWFSFDSALRYLFYYALAAHTMPYIEAFSFQKLSTVKKVLFLVGTGFAFLLFASYYQFGRGYIPSLFHVELPFYGQIVELIIFALVGIYCILIISKILGNVTGLQNLGKASLVLCAAEMPTKLLVPIAFEAVGLSMQYTSSAHNAVCCIIFLLAGYYGMAKPIEKYFPVILGKPHTKEQTP